jgi:hypothetical protein
MLKFFPEVPGRPSFLKRDWARNQATSKANMVLKPDPGERPSLHAYSRIKDIADRPISVPHVGGDRRQQRPRKRAFGDKVADFMFMPDTFLDATDVPQKGHLKKHTYGYLLSALDRTQPEETENLNPRPLGPSDHVQPFGERAPRPPMYENRIRENQLRKAFQADVAKRVAAHADQRAALELVIAKRKEVEILQQQKAEVDRELEIKQKQLADMVH